MALTSPRCCFAAACGVWVASVRVPLGLYKISLAAAMKPTMS